MFNFPGGMPPSEDALLILVVCSALLLMTDHIFPGQVAGTISTSGSNVPVSSPVSLYEDLLDDERLPLGYTETSYTRTWELVQGIPKYAKRTPRLHL